MNKITTVEEYAKWFKSNPDAKFAIEDEDLNVPTPIDPPNDPDADIRDSDGCIDAEKYFARAKARAIAQHAAMPSLLADEHLVEIYNEYISSAMNEFSCTKPEAQQRWYEYKTAEAVKNLPYTEEDLKNRFLAKYGQPNETFDAAWNRVSINHQKKVSENYLRNKAIGLAIGTHVILPEDMQPANKNNSLKLVCEVTARSSTNPSEVLVKVKSLINGVAQNLYEDYFKDSDLRLEPLQSVSPVITHGIVGDWSEDVLQGQLGEICQTQLSPFPRSYAWPALITAAGAMTPYTPPEPGVVSQREELTNFYTALVGPVHSGKSQAIGWARDAIGLGPLMYSQIKASSSEGLLKALHNMSKKQLLDKSLLVDLDEWSHLFAKARIEHASFPSFLHSAFYSRNHIRTLAGGHEIDLQCALSFIGGIVDDMFDDSFGASAMGGLHDRFMFGNCPENYNFSFRPFEGQRSNIKPIPVSINPDVWELIDDIRHGNNKIGREAEIGFRVAKVCASFDGRPILYAKDCEKSLRAFVNEQFKVREFLKPNEGITYDAVVYNSIWAWFSRKYQIMEVVTERDIQRGLQKTKAKYGPRVFNDAMKSLEKDGIIISGHLPDAKPYAGRMPKVYQLLRKHDE